VKILIANRGEIAVRIVRACRELGLGSVAVYSDCDRAAPHVAQADEAWALGADEPAQSYLRIDRLIDIARGAGARAVHPGYGFLAENPEFAQACRDAGLLFIGPEPRVIALLGSKTAAREAAAAAGVPVVPGTGTALGEEVPLEQIAAAADRIGYPLLVKAVAGGGGKGMRAVAAAPDLGGAVETARSEAGSAFGDRAIYLERLIERPRHIEVQLLGDGYGTVLPFVERECSIQRRHQKVVEEAPSLAITPALRETMAAAAAAIARGVGYTGAGTIEFLVAGGRFYFLEMNTRLQVEHPVTEMVTGIDLVHWQIRIARGERLDLDPSHALVPRGHAIECRVYAEDPDEGFMPSPGRITALRVPAGPGVRDDGGVAAGFTVPIYYDSLLSKLIAWGEDRPAAVARMRRALGEYQVQGVRTTLPFFRWLMVQPDFLAGRFDTEYLDRTLAGRATRMFAEPSGEDEDLAAIAAAVHVFLRSGPSAQGVPASGGWRRAGRLAGLREAGS
jgi:acetyl-CoA carboxylase, biotin carboxylase subunit